MEALDHTSVSLYPLFVSFDYVARMALCREVVYSMKRILCVALIAVLMISLPLTASAQTYSLEYPSDSSYNSGSPLWLHCRIGTFGEVLIVIDPNTNIQAFGFDSPNGYNLINNTGSTIYGRCYVSGTSTAYNARWTSFYKLQLQTGTSNYGQPSYEDYNIYEIYGTTLDLIDYTDADRGNDYYKGLNVDYRQLIVVIVGAGLVITLLNFFLFRRGHK